MNANEVTYRELTPSDGDRINDLFARSYGRVRTPDQWRWEFTRAPGGSPVLWAAEAGGRLIGHYALIPLEMSSFGQPLKGAKAESAMVDPEYRGRGICSRLVELTLRDARQRGISVVWGFPNERSFRIMERSGRIHIGGLYGYIRVLRRGRVLRAYLRRCWRRSSELPAQGRAEAGAPLTDRLAGERILTAQGLIGESCIEERCIDERFQELWERSRDRLGITVNRSPEYLAWRFGTNPYGRYLILTQGPQGGIPAGYMISTLRREGELSIGYIVDFLSAGDGAEVFAGLLTGTLQRLGAAGADMAVLFLNPAHPLCRPLLPVLKKQHFHRRNRPKQFSIKVISDENGSPRDARNEGQQRWHRIENWYLTGAFGEGVEY